MRKKIVGIFICMLLICTATIFVSGKIINDEEKNGGLVYYYEFVFLNGEINNLKEEIINNETHYTFHCVSVKTLVLMYVPLIHLHFQKTLEKNLDTGFSVKNFIGRINDDHIFGLVFGRVQLP